MKKTLLSTLGVLLLLLTTQCATAPTENSAPSLEARRAIRLEPAAPRDTTGVDTVGAAATAPDARQAAGPRPW